MSGGLQNRLQALGQRPWRMWGSQLFTIVRMELKRNFFTRRGSYIYLLAFAPTTIIMIHALVDGPRGRCNIQEDTRVLATIFQFYYLRLGIFFGCMGIFTWLFRGEVIERSLHYYFLAPLRRELLVLGKFIAGAITAIAFFGLGVLGSFAFMYSHFGPLGAMYLRNGPGMSQLWAYLTVTALACLGYGALFLALSLLFRNPIVPGVLVLGWETISGVLPSMLQKLSVTYYLKHLCPVDVPAEGFLALFTVVTEPIPRALAVVGLLVLTAAVLVFACVRVRSVEISYSTD